MESSSTPTVASAYRSAQLKAFDDTKTGVKGLVDAGITDISGIFHNIKQPATFDTIPTIDLRGRVFDDMIKRKNAIEEIKDAAGKWGFFLVINHGVSLDLLEKMKDGVRGFHEQSPEVRKEFYSRDFNRKFIYLSNFDLYTAPAANWRDTFYSYMAPDPPKSMHLITNDKFISLAHRVLANKATRARVSVACFFTTNMRPNPRLYGPIRELVSEEDPPNYGLHYLLQCQRTLTEPLLCSIL